MRVLSVMPGVNPSAGAERSFALTAPGLIERGIELHLVVFTDRQGLVPELEHAGVVVHDRSGSTTLWRRCRSLREVIAATKPDLVHATLWDAAVPAQLVCRRSGVPLVVTWANVGSWARGDGSERAWRQRVVRRVDQALARYSKCSFHAVTAGVAEVNTAALRVAPSRAFVVERGRPDLAATESETTTSLRRELGLDDAASVVLAIGRQEPQKDHVTLVGAAARLAAERPELRVLIAGRDGGATRQLTAAIDAAGMARTITLLGQRDDVVDLLRLADVFVSSSRYEGAAGAVIEAMQTGTPIVSTDVAGQRGILADEENALVVPVGDSAAMAAAIGLLLEDPARAAELGQAGRATYEQRFTLEHSVSGLESMYRQIATG